MRSGRLCGGEPEGKGAGQEPERKMDFSNLLFSFQGRINRAKFWLAVLVYMVASIVGGIIGAASGSDIVAGLVNGLVGLLTFLSGLFVAIKRLHDRDKSAGWLLLFYFAPSILAAFGLVLIVLAGHASGVRPVGLLFALAGLGVAMWAFVEMGCLRGTVGPNRYGADPPRDAHRGADALMQPRPAGRNSI
jgi:uncharacterized membrane protein YhaH (DUF805 family)